MKQLELVTRVVAAQRPLRALQLEVRVSSSSHVAEGSKLNLEENTRCLKCFTSNADR